MRVTRGLAGGGGAARFLQVPLAVHRPSDITIISNVGDDAEFFGLHVSPDIDIVLYHLAGLSDEERGFGLKDDTFNVLDAIARYGYDTWFRLGDLQNAPRSGATRAHVIRGDGRDRERPPGPGANRPGDGRPAAHKNPHGRGRARLPGLLRPPSHRRPHARDHLGRRG